MNKAVEWFRGNLAIPTLMMLVAAAVASLYQAGEVTASNYRTLRNSFQEGSAAYRGAVAEAMRSGQVSRWEYSELLQHYWRENSGLSMDFGPADLAEERVALASMTEQLNAR